jgi:hypothetical protein
LAQIRLEELFMVSTFLKIVAANSNERLYELASKIKGQKNPYLWILTLLATYSLLSVVNSFIWGYALDSGRHNL